MTESLEILGPIRQGGFDIYEAVDESHGNPDEHIYSCVALCRTNWRRAWPALGGTRWFQRGREGGVASNRDAVRSEAVELAMSMYIKNSLLRNAAHAEGLDAQYFDWQGGKGVIWTPPGVPLSPERLFCHGRLVESLHGQYIASKDLGIGTLELKWISYATRYTIGLNCLRDTGEATAHGVLTGLRTAAQQHAGELGADAAHPLRGVSILVCGVGKVGYPLIGLLSAEGADVYAFDPKLADSPEAVREWCRRYEDSAAPPAVRQRNADALEAVRARGGILDKDREGAALRHPSIQIVSPNGGGTRWLSETFEDGRTRADVLAETRRTQGRLRLILGAGNDQVPITDFRRSEREPVLSALTDAGITYVPDPLVSPGGVIAVSHELAPTWDVSAVNETAVRIVRKSVDQVYRGAKALGGFDATRMYQAFEGLVEEEWT